MNSGFDEDEFENANPYIHIPFKNQNNMFKRMYQSRYFEIFVKSVNSHFTKGNVQIVERKQGIEHERTYGEYMTKLSNKSWDDFFYTAAAFSKEFERLAIPNLIPSTVCCYDDIMYLSIKVENATNRQLLELKQKYSYVSISCNNPDILENLLDGTIDQTDYADTDPTTLISSFVPLVIYLYERGVDYGEGELK